MFEIHASKEAAEKKLTPLAAISDLQRAEKTAQRIGKRAKKCPVIVYVPPVVL